VRSFWLCGHSTSLPARFPFDREILAERRHPGSLRDLFPIY
jgi:hypothetical protein